MKSWRLVLLSSLFKFYDIKIHVAQDCSDTDDAAEDIEHPEGVKKKEHDDKKRIGRLREQELFD